MPLFLDTKYSDDNDWDYSVPVTCRDESFELDDLQLLEDEIYQKTTAHDNSLVVDEEEAPPRPRFVRHSHKELEGKCTCLIIGDETLKEERPESLFYQTYPKLKPDSSTHTFTTTKTSNCLGSPLLLLDQQDEQHINSNSSSSSMEKRKKKKSPTNTTTTADSMVFMTTPPHGITKHTKRATNQNPRNQTKKTTHLHVSTIPPPSCSWNLLSHDDDKHKNTVMPIDMFADYNTSYSSSQVDHRTNGNDHDECSSVATSIVSTTLGSMDTPAHYVTYNDDGEVYYLGEEKEDVHGAAISFASSHCSSPEESEYTPTTTIQRGVPSVEYMHSNTKDCNVVQQEQECKNPNVYVNENAHLHDDKPEFKGDPMKEPVVKKMWFPYIIV